jgi:DNA-binding NarL/FixJ family response regulator
VKNNDYDIVILDITMPGRNGLDVLVDLKNLKPKLPVLVLSMHPEEQFALRAYKSGASGYLTKGSPSSELLDALHKISLGKKYVSAILAESLVTGLNDVSQQNLQHSLSNREYQVMSLIGSGKTVGKIAEELVLSVKTVSTYRAHILAKLNMKNNAEITRFVIENNLL